MSVETGTQSWVCRCESDIMSVQLDNSVTTSIIYVSAPLYSFYILNIDFDVTCPFLNSTCFPNYNVYTSPMTWRTKLVKPLECKEQ